MRRRPVGEGESRFATGCTEGSAASEEASRFPYIGRDAHHHSLLREIRRLISLPRTGKVILETAKSVVGDFRAFALEP